MMLQGAMTAISVLTRVLPFLLEAYRDSETGEVDPALDRMFWSVEEVLPTEASGGEGGDTGAGAGGDGEVHAWCMLGPCSIYAPFMVSHMAV